MRTSVPRKNRIRKYSLFEQDVLPAHPEKAGEQNEMHLRFLYLYYF